MKETGSGACDAEACEASLATSKFYGRIEEISFLRSEIYQQNMIDKNSEGRMDQPGLDELLSLQEAAELSGLSQPHLSLLIRQGKLWGKKIGRNWVTTEQAVREYLACDRRPGPKSKKST